MNINQIAESILRHSLTYGGYTHQQDGRYVVALENRAVPLHDEETAIETIAGFLRSNRNFGTWIDGNWIYVDRIVCLDDKETALDLARQYKQRAIYDLDKGEEIYVK